MQWAMRPAQSTSLFGMDSVLAVTRATSVGTWKREAGPVFFFFGLFFSCSFVLIKLEGFFDVERLHDDSELSYHRREVQAGEAEKPEKAKAEEWAV